MAKGQNIKTIKTSHGVRETKGVQEKNEARMPLSGKNYLLMLVGLGVIIVGFLLMTGGGSGDPEVFSQKMFDFRRITLAPIVVIAGFAFEVYAIMWRGKK